MTSVKREMYENFDELFAIIKASGDLIKNIVRDIISPNDHKQECQKIIAHFKTIAATLKDTVPSFEGFHDAYKMYVPAALNRLVTSDVPAKVEHKAAVGMSSNASAPVVAECTQNFITTTNLLELNMVAVDQIVVYHFLTDHFSSVNKLTILPHDFEGKTRWSGSPGW